MHNRRVQGLVIALLAGLLGFTLLVQGVLTTLQHRDHIRLLFQEGVSNEMNHAAAFVNESLRRHDYATVRSYLASWTQRAPHIVHLNAANSQFTLVNYRREAVSESEYALSRDMQVDQQTTLTLTVAFSLDHLGQQTLVALPLQVGVILFTTLIFGLVLWQMLNLVAVRPLREEIERRRAVKGELVQAREAAEAASRAKSAFLTHVSHELRTPLNLILGYSQLLERDAGLNERQRYSIASIHHSGDHLLALIKNTLELAGVENGSLELAPTRCDLPGLLREVCSIESAKAGRKGLTFRHVLSADLPSLAQADRRRLQEICQHLLDNAIKFTETGSVGLEAGFREGMLHLDVRDTGIGIPPDRLKTVFQPFVKVDDFQYRYGGTGLGLTLTQYLVNLMQGQVTAESHPGLGSRFSVRMPLTVLATSAPASTAPSGPTDEETRPAPMPTAPPLPGAELRAMAEMAAIGNLRGIKEYLERIPAEYAAEPWVELVGQHIRGYDLKALRRLLEATVDAPPPPSPAAEPQQGLPPQPPPF